jgi:hypothetical protein
VRVEQVVGEQLAERVEILRDHRRVARVVRGEHFGGGLVGRWS